MRTPALLLFVFLMGTAAAFAQDAVRPPDAQPDLSPAEIQRLFDAMLVADAQRALVLTDKQYPDFVTGCERCRKHGGRA